MQDKEFDNVFRSKLEDIEVEPSAQVWQNINTELAGKKKRMFPLLSIAASIILLIAAGVLFIPKKEVVRPGKPGKNTLAQHTVKPTVIEVEQNKAQNTPTVKERQVAVNPTSAKTKSIQHLGKKIGTPVVEKEEVESSVTKTEAIKAEEQPVLAVVPQKAEESKTVLPTAEIAAPAKQEVKTEAVDLHTKPVLASVQIPAKQDKPALKKKGIHNFGDLVNLVVASVDKRKDKVIEFSDTDDDQTTITGVHLGAINIKRDNSAGN